MKVYISGPITGRIDGNREAFYEAAEQIAERGHQPINPHDLAAALPDTAAWSDYMHVDLAAMVECDAIAQLDGWLQSRGARLESIIAHELGLRTYDLRLGAVI